MTKYYIQSDSYVESWKNILADLLKNGKPIWLGDGTLPIYQAHRFCKSHLFQSVAQHAAATMSVASPIIGTTVAPVDDGKRYNVWCIPEKRWTNFPGQNSKNPKPLTHQEALDLMVMINGKYGEFEIRKVIGCSDGLIDKSVTVEKTGMNCAGQYCNEFNPHAEPNQPDGTYKCYSCRGR